MKRNARDKARRSMEALYREDPQRYDDCGEVIATKLAEDTANAIDRWEWLDDPDHWIWEMAHKFACRMEAQAREEDD